MNRLTLTLAALLTAGAAHAERVALPNLPVSVDAPSLLELNAGGISKLFPGVNRPEAVLLTGDQRVVMSFEWRPTSLRTTEVGTLVQQFPAVLRKQVPNLKSLTQGALQLNGTQWAQFVITAPGKTGDVRREMLVTSAGGRMLILTISGLATDYTKNLGTILAFRNSLKVN
ncbi:hypothetical protein [Deinococcus maricopensis]|uniref:DUF1795 domain-containing protein n=1 Tax=Deinococcus maricopensis (strain DSM 21211 / LMG 22137 / NRRL B-23946 / LB-34) TaxID=709986 RepID=E8U854_DEIML|nr:hypothetical protein [Deinococcus maricopensis]ADV67243.1 hypothetical protein Deima_1594 [Deinococcus maricopensis DSM 21211]